MSQSVALNVECVRSTSNVCTRSFSTQVRVNRSTPRRHISWGLFCCHLRLWKAEPPTQSLGHLSYVFRSSGVRLKLSLHGQVQIRPAGDLARGSRSNVRLTSKGEETLSLLAGPVEGKLMSCVFDSWDDKALKIVSRTSPCWHDSDVSVLSPIPTGHLDQK